MAISKGTEKQNNNNKISNSVSYRGILSANSLNWNLPTRKTEDSRASVSQAGHFRRASDEGGRERECCSLNEDAPSGLIFLKN